MIQPRRFGWAAFIILVINSLGCAGVNRQSKSLSECIRLAEKDQFDESMECFDVLLAEDPGNSRARYNRGAALRRKGDLELALKDMDQAVQLDPTYSMALYGRGVVLMQLGRSDEAVESLRRCVELDPGSRAGWLSLAQAHLAGGELDAALTSVERGMSAGADERFEGLKLKAAILEAQGRFAEAIALLDPALTDEPKDVGLLYAKAVALTGVDDYSGAKSVLLLAGSIDPTQVAIWVDLAGVYQMLGLLINGLGCVEKAIELDQNSGPAWLRKSAILYLLGKHSESIEAGKRAVALQPENAEAWSMLGGAYAKAGHEGEAIETLRKAASLGSTQAAKAVEQYDETHAGEKAK